MAALPPRPMPTVDAIYASYETQFAKQGKRPHLGASLIGRECSREIWYRFRWCDVEAPTGRMLRLFARGSAEEGRLVNDLRNAGVEVHDVDPQTRKQHSVSAFGGHFAGSMDGVARGLKEAPKTWAILEFKTASDKSFKDICKKTCKVAKPEHWAQMQIYMGLAELDRAAYFAVNKNDDSIYFEWVHFDRVQFDALLMRAKRIITATAPLEKISDKEDKPPCSWCEFKALCHGQRVPPVSCRTCMFAAPDTDKGTWRCAWHSKDLTCDDQRLACPDHVFITELIPFARPVKASTGAVLYEMADGRGFVNCGQTGFPGVSAPHFSSAELAVIDLAAIGNETVEAVRKAFDARVVG